MSEMKRIESKEYSYLGYNHIPAKCHLQIFKDEHYCHHVVIVTELPNNTGASITNAIEILAQNITSEYNIHTMTMIEHYHRPLSIDDAIDDDTLDIVTFEGDNYSNPKWARTTLEEVRAIIHSPIDKLDPEQTKEDAGNAIDQLEI